MLCWPCYFTPIIFPSRFGSKDTSLQTPVGSILGRPDAGLSEFLLVTKDLECTDDRDRLYGIMLLTNNVTDGDIDVDYSLSAAETFMTSMLGLYTEKRTEATSREIFSSS
jgi:hypothetical protein